MLKGKGIWIENLSTTDNNGDPDTLVMLARRADMQHVIIRVAENTSPVPDDRIDNVIRAFQAAGRVVWGAHRVSGNDPVREAQLSAQVVQALGVDGLAIVAESAYMGKHQQAAAYMDTLNRLVQGLPIGLSSFRFPDTQDPPGFPDSQTFPFDAFLTRCGIALPKVFWVARDAGDPAGQLRESLRQYRKRWPNVQYYPVGAAYGVRYGDLWWTAAPETIGRFIDQAAAFNLAAVSFWAWDTARFDESNETFPNTELWDAIASHPFDVTDDPMEAFFEEITIRPGDTGYKDGAYEDAQGIWHEHRLPDGRTISYAPTIAGPNRIWARWDPDLTERGNYEIRIFVPRIHATTQFARYHVQGAQWGRQSETRVIVDQSKYYDQWVSLGTFEFDPAVNPNGGVVALTDQTPESPPREVAFDAVQWRRALKDVIVVGASRPTAEGVDSPVGDQVARTGQRVWPFGWAVTTGFAAFDEDGYQPGVMLVNAAEQDDSQPVYAPMSGVITWAEQFGQWEYTVILDADPLADGTKAWLRFTLLDQVVVQDGARVTRGQLLGHTGPVQGRYPAHLGYDVAKVSLNSRPWDWPGADRARVLREYLDPLTFTRGHRPVIQTAPDFPLGGLHEGGDWLLANLPGPTRGWTVEMWDYAGNQNPTLDFTHLADRGVRVLLRVGFGYADGTGTLPPPDRLTEFENGVIRALEGAKGVYAVHYGNEANNATEFPTGFELTPEYYVQSYNRIWRRLPDHIKMAPVPIDPYHSYQGSNPRTWWRTILNGIEGAHGLVLHCKTQGNSPAEIESDAKFTDPPLAGWQFLHFRVMETSLEDVPSGMRHLPVWITESNPQRKNDGRYGWEPNNSEWVHRCFEYIRNWNANPSHQPIHANILYRYPMYDDWRMDDKPLIMGAFREEAQQR